MKTEPNRVDALVMIVKGALGAIPYVGSICAEIVGAVIPNQRVDRITKLVEALAQKVADLDHAVVEQRLETPEGVDLLEDGFHQAARALSDERIAYISNVLTKGFTEAQVKHAEDKMLMRLLEQLTDPEIVLLFWMHKGGRDANLREKHREIVIAPNPRGDLAPADVEKRILHEAREAHLRTLGLLFQNTGGVRWNPHYDRPTSVTEHTEVTPLGRLLIRTILPPTEPSKPS